MGDVEYMRAKVEFNHTKLQKFNFVKTRFLLSTQFSIQMRQFPLNSIIA